MCSDLAGNSGGPAHQPRCPEPFGVITRVGRGDSFADSSFFWARSCTGAWRSGFRFPIAGWMKEHSPDMSSSLRVEGRTPLLHPRASLDLQRTSKGTPIWGQWGSPARGGCQQGLGPRALWAETPQVSLIANVLNAMMKQTRMHLGAWCQVRVLSPLEFIQSLCVARGEVPLAPTSPLWAFVPRASTEISSTQPLLRGKEEEDSLLNARSFAMFLLLHYVRAPSPCR